MIFSEVGVTIMHWICPNNYIFRNRMQISFFFASKLKIAYKDDFVFYSKNPRYWSPNNMVLVIYSILIQLHITSKVCFNLFCNICDPTAA